MILIVTVYFLWIVLIIESLATLGALSASGSRDTRAQSDVL